MPLSRLHKSVALVGQWWCIQNAGLFDPQFYAGQAGVGRWGQIFPLMHYLVYGEDCGLKPNLRFDPVFYRSSVGGNLANTAR